MFISLINPRVGFAQDSEYDENSFNQVFADINFGRNVLEALGQDPYNVDWKKVNDVSLSGIRSIMIDYGTEKLDGLEKLSGLRSIILCEAEVQKFPDGIENSIKDLESLSIVGGSEPIKIPKFAALTTLSCGSGQAIDIESKESIEGMSNLQYLNLSNLRYDENSIVNELDFSKLQHSLVSLNISENELQSVPESVYSLSGLKSFFIDSNNLVSLPENLIDNMPELSVLSISNCGFESIPSEIFKLENLTYLDLSYNSLKSISGDNDRITKLENLNYLNLSGCGLDAFPTNILDMAELSNLSLSNNSIKELPGGVDGIGKLKKLTYLNIDNCELDMFPDITQNKYLESINICGNYINSIPDTIDISSMPQLMYLNLEDNYFISVPMSLVDHNKKNNEDIYASMRGNFIKLKDNSIENNIYIDNQKQLSFLQIPSRICTSDEINIFNHLKGIDTNGYETDISPEMVDLTVTIDDVNTSNANISTDGILKITTPGKYLLTARIKGADADNTLATVCASIVVSENPDESEIYNKDRLNKVFPDETFRNEVLRRIRVDPANIEGKVTEKQLAEIKYFAIEGNEIKSVEGLGKLTGLEQLQMYNTSITNLPTGVEDSLKNLQVLYIGGNENPLTIPKFVTLTELACTSSSGQSWSVSQGQVLNKESKEAIEAMPLLKSLILNNNYNEQENYSIAEEIDYSKLSSLEILDLSSNQLTKLPESILSLQKLENLYLENNKITLPDSFKGKLNSLKELSLFGCGLNSIPECIFELEGLNQLVLNNNIIKVVPSDIEKLVNLTELYIGNCGLTAFPENILKLPNIFTLSLGYNNIVSIPEEIKKLNKLEYLSIYDCGLKEFPKQLLSCEKLSILNLANNNITAIPEEISKLSNLTNLDIRDCGLNSFPFGVLDIKELQILYISNNKISNIPSGDNGIGKLENLTELEAVNCNLSDFPDLSLNKSLEFLNLDYNNILDVPQLEQLKTKNLWYIGLSGNNLTKVPQGVIDDMNNNFTNYYIAGNYFNIEDTSLEGEAYIIPGKQLLIGLPESITVSDKIDLTNNMYNELWGTIEKNTAGSEVYEFGVTSNGNPTSNASINKDGILSFRAAGTYDIEANIKGADKSNKCAYATFTLTVNEKVKTKPNSGSVNSGKSNGGSNSNSNSNSNTSTNVKVEPEAEVPAVEPRAGIITSVVGNKTVCDVMLSINEADKLIKDKVFAVDLSSLIKEENALINIPTDIINNMLTKGTEKISIMTPYGILGLNLKGIDLKNAKDLCLSINKADSALIEGEKTAIGKSKVLKFLLEIKKSDEALEKLGLESMDLELYLNAGVDGDTDLLTAYSSTMDGKVENIGGKYDPSKKAVLTSVQNGASVVVATNKMSFSDLTLEHWANKFIIPMAAKGIINGYNDGSFKPDGNITRAEFGVLIAKLLKLDTDIKGSSFTDVKDTDWFSKYIEAAAKADIISGWNGMFKPNDFISRQDAAVILSKAIQYIDNNKGNTGNELSFADKDLISGYALNHIRNVASLEIMSGKPGNLFDPKGLTKRGEVARMLYVVFNLNE